MLNLYPSVGVRSLLRACWLQVFGGLSLVPATHMLVFALKKLFLDPEAYQIKWVYGLAVCVACLWHVQGSVLLLHDLATQCRELKLRVRSRLARRVRLHAQLPSEALSSLRERRRVRRRSQ